MKFIPTKTILSGYESGNNWFGKNYTMNIYKGCCHGCIYCDSRSECYGVENFDEVRAKENALALLQRELRAKRRAGVIGTGAMSDPYNPFEKKYRLTRDALELIHNVPRFGISIATKSDLIIRDLDVLTSIKRHSPVLVKLTITTADDALGKKIEPNVAESSRRFSVIKELSDNGIFSGILLMPVLPFLEDHENNISEIIRLAYEHGAKFIYPAFGVTLRKIRESGIIKSLMSIFLVLSKNT
jgi:DNA repair photolyase